MGAENYPAGFDGYDASAIAAGQSARSADIRLIGDALSGVQNTLGLNPHLPFGSVAARITGVESTVSGHATHAASTSNPHSVTAAQVGNSTAQWNADELQGNAISSNAPNDAEVLTWDDTSGVWSPQAAAGGSATINSGDFVLRNETAAQTIQGNLDPNDSGVINLGTAEVPYGHIHSTINSIKVHSGNGYGSVNNKIRRFSTVQWSYGDAITYTDSATSGAYFDINRDGIYAIAYNDQANTTHSFGASVNSIELTTSIASINVANMLGYTRDSTNANGFFGITAPFASGDVVRVHTDAAGVYLDGNNRVMFCISKVA